MPGQQPPTAGQGRRCHLRPCRGCTSWRASKANIQDHGWLAMELFFLVLLGLWASEKIQDAGQRLRATDLGIQPGNTTESNDTLTVNTSGTPLRYRRNAQTNVDQGPTEPNLGAAFGQMQLPLPESLPADKRLMDAVQTTGVPECGEDFALESAKPYTALLVQEAVFTRITARRCKAYLSTMMSFCGSTSHITGPISEGSKMREALPISAEE